MTNCEWTNSKIEAYFTDELTAEDWQRFQTHQAGCAECRQQIESLKHMDTLVRGVLQRRIAIARLASQTNTRPRVVRIMLAGMGVAVAALLLVTALPFLQQQPPAPPITTNVPAPPNLLEDVKKDNTTQNTDRTKPDEAKPAVAVVPTLDPIPPDAPDFAISDAAGYTTTLETYRGRVFLFGVVSRDEKKAVAGLQEIHDALASNNAIRIVGVTRRHEENLEGGTFPVFFNHGSKLFGIGDGEFLLVDAAGTPRLKGTLSETGNVARIKTQLSQINGR